MEKTDREGENVMQALFDAVNAICGKIQVVSDLFWEFPTNFGWYAAIPILGNFSLAIILLVGTGIFLTFRFRFVQVRKFKYGLKVLLHSKAATKTGISALAAFLLSTAMRVGPGNILGAFNFVQICGYQNPLEVFFFRKSDFHHLLKNLLQCLIIAVGIKQHARLVFDSKPCQADDL